MTPESTKTDSIEPTTLDIIDPPNGWDYIYDKEKDVITVTVPTDTGMQSIHFIPVEGVITGEIPTDVSVYQSQMPMSIINSMKGKIVTPTRLLALLYHGTHFFREEPEHSIHLLYYSEGDDGMPNVEPYSGKLPDVQISIDSLRLAILVRRGE